MFVLGDGTLLPVNEIAPRVHNSGHWTPRRCLDVAVRAAHPGGGGLAARQADPQKPGRNDLNLIGHEVDDYRKWLTVPGAAVHLYGKIAVHVPAARWGVTRLFAD